MNNSTLCPVDVVGITVSPRVKHQMYLWFVVTHVHLLSRSCNDCFSGAHWVLQTFQKTGQTSDFKRLNKQNLLKKCVLKKKGGTTRTRLFRVKNDKCHSSADMRLGFSSCSWRAHYSTPPTQNRSLYNWNTSPDLKVSFPANNRVASSNFSLKQLLGPSS